MRGSRVVCRSGGRCAALETEGPEIAFLGAGWSGLGLVRRRLRERVLGNTAVLLIVEVPL